MIKGTMLIMVMADTVDPEITRVVPGLTAILRRRRRRAVVAVVEHAVQSVSLRRTWKPTQVVVQQRFQGRIIRRRPLEGGTSVASSLWFASCVFPPPRTRGSGGYDSPGTTPVSATAPQHHCHQPAPRLRQRVAVKNGGA